MLTKCVNCEFNVELNARFCLNCGTEDPSKDSLFSEKRDFPRDLMVLIVVICVVLAGAIRIIADESNYPEISFSYLAPALFIGLVIGILAAITLAPVINVKVTKKNKRERKTEKAGKTLCGKEDEIYEKIHSFTEDNIYLESLSKELGADSSEEFYTAEEENVLAKLELVECEITLCHLQLEEIKLLRRENKIAPYLKNLNFLTLDEIDDALPIVAQEIDEEEAEDSQTFEIEIDTEDGDRIHARINEADEIVNRQYSELQKSCENLYEALKRRKIALENKKTPMQELALSAKSAPADSEDFKIDSILTDFSVYFDRLAAEHRKLDETIEKK